MKTKVFILAVLMTLGLAACNTMKSEKIQTMKGHDGLSEQQKLIACADCHKEVTPEIYTQWYDSTHGIGYVKCYQCHNSFEDIVVAPDINQSCNSCHADKVDDIDHTEGLTTCWQCHEVHSFSVK